MNLLDTVIKSMRTAELSGYKLKYLINTGAYGMVYEAEDALLAERVAIKFQMSEVAFNREIKAFGMINGYKAKDPSEKSV